MKRYFLLVLFCLVIFSIYSVSADYHGTINVNVGSSVSVNIGNPPSFNVTNGTTQTQSSNPVTTSSGGGGGGRSSITSNSVTNPTTGGACTENWQCSAFGDCTNGNQVRTCTDTNNCGTTTNRPVLTQVCTTQNAFGITGGAIGAIDNFVKTGAGIATVIFIVTVLIVGILILIVRKGKVVKKV